MRITFAGNNAERDVGMAPRLAAVALSLFCAVAASADDYPGLVQDPETKPPGSLPGAAKEFLDVPYLDDSRDTVTYGGWPEKSLAYRCRLNVYVPTGEGPFPCLIYVHGGGYGAGHGTQFGLWNSSRFNGTQVDPAQEGMKRGYVLVCFNYILGGDGIHPQVQRDFKQAVRFLRANRQKFRLDPNRMGAVGSSAGGWLITSAGLTTADDFGQRSQHSRNIAELVSDPNAWTRDYHLSRRKGESIVYSSFDEIEPRHPQVSSRLNALAFDFFHQLQAVSPDDPNLLSVAGSYDVWWERSAKLPNLELLQRKVTLIDYGKHNAEKLSKNDRLPGVLHVPSNNMPVPSADGKATVPAVVRVFQFFDEQLKSPAARTPAAEARPNSRFFKDRVEVTFATADPDATVYYTLDGSDPTTESPVAAQPIRLDATTTVKFISVASGMQPSGVATATFIKGKTLPRVTSPDVSVLPIATVGKPYEVQFEAAGATRWHFQLGNPGVDKEKAIIAAEGRESVNALRNRNYNLYHIGLDVDPTTGRMFGTPLNPGTFVLQVVTACEANGPGGCRTYTLVVLPEGG